MHPSLHPSYASRAASLAGTPVQPRSRVPRQAVRAGIVQCWHRQCVLVCIVHVKFKPPFGPFVAVYKTARWRGSLGLSNRHFGTDWWPRVLNRKRAISLTPGVLYTARTLHGTRWASKPTAPLKATDKRRCTRLASVRPKAGYARTAGSKMAQSAA